VGTTQIVLLPTQIPSSIGPSKPRDVIFGHHRPILY
jgi:hypothetical protein